MITPPPPPESHWQRPYWRASGEDAMLIFFVFGHFTGDTQALAAALELPRGIKLTRYAHAALRNWEGYPLAGALGEVFADEAPHTLEKASASDEVLRLAGTVHDPADLGYLRDALAAITELFDAGAVAVADPQTSSLFDRETWRRRFGDHADTSMRGHVLVLCDADPDTEGAQWVHTRGMRKFARPDVSVTGVPASEVNRAGALCQTLIEMLARGSQFADGQQLEVEGMATPLTAHLGGSVDDPRFYNTHAELRWPG
jgi:hypothetical protein